MENGAKPRDLEDRTFLFAESVRSFVKQLPRTTSNTEDVARVNPDLFPDLFQEWRVMINAFWDLLDIDPLFGLWSLDIGTSETER